MTDDDTLLGRLIADEPGSGDALLAAAQTSERPDVLVAAAQVASDPDVLLERADALAATARQRQLVALARARLEGDPERLDALARDHLADHPDHVLAAWIAARGVVDRPQDPTTPPTRTPTTPATTPPTTPPTTARREDRP